MLEDVQAVTDDFHPPDDQRTGEPNNEQPITTNQ
jgi:hypothetical protein